MFVNFNLWNSQQDTITNITKLARALAKYNNIATSTCLDFYIKVPLNYCLTHNWFQDMGIRTILLGHLKDPILFTLKKCTNSNPKLDELYTIYYQDMFFFLFVFIMRAYNASISKQKYMSLTSIKQSTTDASGVAKGLIIFNYYKKTFLM